MLTFQEWIKSKGYDVAKLGKTTPLDDRFKVLEGLVDSLQEMFDPTRKEIRFTIVPGHLVNIGQQYRVLRESPRLKYSDTFFRIYINQEEWILDDFSEEMTHCNDEQSLYEAMWNYLDKDEVKSSVYKLIQLAQKAA
ncbi:MAG: hypothetical protein NTX50_29425 [Candidatus Sumerlaeota bacterium]|nr:hypothetical protein [Candidatus Sumerlaeota bacterium]